MIKSGVAMGENVAKRDDQRPFGNSPEQLGVEFAHPAEGRSREKSPAA